MTENTGQGSVSAQDGQAETASGPTLAERRFERLRLLPVLMIAATLLFGVKLGNIWQDADAVLTGIPRALAQDNAAAGGDGNGGETDGSAGQDTGNSQDSAKTAESENVQSGGGGAASGDAAPYSRGELQLLQNLADRRSTLDEREQELEMREKVLSAMEKRIDEKIARVKSIEKKISAHLEQYNDRHEKNVAKLIKVYESMEAEEAARIFEQLEMDILLKVAGEIRETKMASILSEMDPAEAKNLTVELATKDPIPLADNVKAGE